MPLFLNVCRVYHMSYGVLVRSVFALSPICEDFSGLHPGPVFFGPGQGHGPGSGPTLKHGALPAVPGGSGFLGRAPCPGCLVFQGACFAPGPVRYVGFGQSLQSPRDLASSRLAWATRRCSSLRSGVWLLFRSYSLRVSFLASTSAGVGWARSLGFLAFGAVFLTGLPPVLLFRCCFWHWVFLDFRPEVARPGRGKESSKVRPSTRVCGNPVPPSLTSLRPWTLVQRLLR